MIMGLERLDRITAFMEEHSAPPRRSSMEPIREAPQEGSPSGSAGAQRRVSSPGGDASSREGNSEQRPGIEPADRRVSGQHTSHTGHLCVTCRLRCSARPLRHEAIAAYLKALCEPWPATCHPQKTVLKLQQVTYCSSCNAW